MTLTLCESCDGTDNHHRISCPELDLHGTKRLRTINANLLTTLEAAENWLTELDPFDEGGQGLIADLRAAIAAAKGEA